MGREATLAEAIHVQVAQEPKKKVVKVVTKGDDEDIEEQEDQAKQSTRAAPKLPIKTFNQEAREPGKPVVKAQAGIPFDDFKRKQKPNQIIVVHRDEETNELIKTFVDKVRRKKLTKIKRAVH